MKQLTSLLLAFTSIFISYKSSLPELYYHVCKKRGIPVKTLRHLEKCGVRMSKLKLDVQYFETCLNLDLCPPKFRLKDAKVTEKALSSQIHRVVVEDALKNVCKDLQKAKSLYSKLLNDINSCLSLVERTSLNSLLCNRFRKEERIIRDRHRKKLFNLWSRQSKYSPDCITNISSKQLTVQEYNALQYGLHHHILPKSFDQDQVKVNIEKALDTIMWRTEEQVDFELREDIKRCYFDFEKKADKVCSSKKNVYLHRTLRSLARNKDICICSYDKGTGVVVMDRKDYYSKLDAIISDSSKFIQIPIDDDNPKSHPIVKKQNSIKYYVQTYVPEDHRKALITSGSQPGKLYGLCKIHKKDYPMRPIVSMINTPEYELAKYLDNFIKPCIPQKYMLNSTQDFLEKINAFPLKGDELMVSYDVVSLFTNVPLEETIDIVTNYVYGPNSPLTPPFKEEVFRKMLLLCSQSYFMYNDILYQQINGVSMGGPLAPTLANACLAHLENELLISNNCSYFPKLFLRYVDDCFALFTNFESADLFLKCLNSLHPSIQFTIERGNQCMPFLDVNVEINSHAFVTSVFRKLTHTGVFLNYHAVAPTAWKKGVILSLLYRAKMICSSVSTLNTEISKLRNMFVANSYPIQFINNVIDAFFRKTNTTIDDDLTPAEDSSPIVILRVPFFGKTSVRFGRNLTNIICNKFNVRVRVVYSTFKLQSYFRLKSLSPFYLLSNVVYQYQCMNDSCSDSYVGYTARHLYERCNEHINIRSSQQSEIKDHVRNCIACQGLCADYTDFTILRKCKNTIDCKFFEAFAIKRLQPSLNKQMFAKGASKILHVWK